MYFISLQLSILCVFTITGSIRSGPSVSPDDDVFRFLALTYSRSHWYMAATNSTLCDDDFFLDGVTNGADWDPIIGGVQDYNYLKEGIMEILIEIACCLFPQESALEDHWYENRNALLNYNFEVHRGIKGIIKNEANTSIEGAELTIKGRESVSFHSSRHGEFFRVLLPGTYTLQVLADRYLFTSKNITVINGGPTRQDITLKLAPLTLSPPTTSTTPTNRNTPLISSTPTPSSTPSISNTPTNSVTPANSARPTTSVTLILDSICMCVWISIMISSYL